MALVRFCKVIRVDLFERFALILRSSSGDRSSCRALIGLHWMIKKTHPKNLTSLPWSAPDGMPDEPPSPPLEARPVTLQAPFKPAHSSPQQAPQACPVVRSSPDALQDTPPRPASDAIKARHDTLSPESPAKALIRPCEPRYGFSATGSAENALGDPDRFWRVLGGDLYALTVLYALTCGFYPQK